VAIASRCQRLRSAPDYEVTLSVHSDSVGVDPEWNVALLDLDIRLLSGHLAGSTRVRATCQPRVGLRALYEIPGRTELFAIVSYVGRPYGCEDIEQDVLLIWTD
jgi:hypothetical protein